MPTVPTEFVPSVGSTAPNMPPAQAGSVEPVRSAAPEQIEQLGGAMVQAGMTAARIGQSIGIKIQNEIDDAKVKGAETKFIQTASDVSTKYLNTSNADSLAGFTPTQEAIVKAKQDAMGSLDNDVQRHIFDNVASQHLISFGQQISQHQAQQRRSYGITESAARADSMRTMAQNVDVGSKDQTAYIATGVSEVQNAYAAKGFPADSEETKKAVRDYQTELVSDNVSRLMVAGKYDDAKTLLGDQMTAGNVDPDVADRLRGSIESNTKRVETDKTASGILATSNGTFEVDDLQAMLKQADQIEDPEMRRDVRSQVSQEWSQGRSLMKEKYNEVLDTAVNYKAAHNGSIKGIDPTVWGALDAKDQQDLIPKPPAVKDNFEVMWNFVTNPDTLTEANVKGALARGQITPDTALSLAGRAQKIQDKPEAIQEATGINERIKYFAVQAGINVSGSKIVDGKPVAAKETADDKQQMISLQYKVQRDIDALKAQNGGKATSEQVDNAIKKQLVQHQLTRGSIPWWSLRMHTDSIQKHNFEMPDGATQVRPMSDGKMHYTDMTGNNDLGVVQ